MRHTDVPPKRATPVIDFEARCARIFIDKSGMDLPACGRQIQSLLNVLNHGRAIRSKRVRGDNHPPRIGAVRGRGIGADTRRNIAILRFRDRDIAMNT